MQFKRNEVDKNLEIADLYNQPDFNSQQDHGEISLGQTNRILSSEQPDFQFGFRNKRNNLTIPQVQAYYSYLCSSG